MKKIVFFLLFSTLGSLAFAQSLDDVKDAMGTDMTKAKTLIDKYLSNPKNASDPDGYYYKGVIYSSLAKKDTAMKTCTDCNMQAFEALKKYQELDSKDIMLKLEQYSSFFVVYGNFFDVGAKAFNKADYSTAFTNFKNAEMVEGYVRSKNIETGSGFKFPALDTSLVQNTALAARLAKDSAGAAVYYKKITDANLSDPQYLVAYEFLVEYYMNAKNDAAFTEVLGKGEKIFPGETDHWTAVELYHLDATSSSKQETFKKYDSLFQKNPTNYTIGYNYAVELYNYIYANEDKNIQTDEYKEPLHELIKKVIAIKPTAEANLLMARYLYNSSFDDGDNARKIKGAKPEDIKNRKALQEKATAQLDECLPYAQAAADYYAALPTLKPSEKGSYRTTLSILQGVYEAKKNQPKADEYDKKMKALL